MRDQGERVRHNLLVSFMISVPDTDQPKTTELAPAMDEAMGILPVCQRSPASRCSDAGILPLAAIEQRLKIAERLAACIEDPRDPDRVVHELAEMIRYPALC
jgi:hypothetical protein